ncbi:indole-3-glycerol phosphate synthase [Helicobacter bizzozeronii]|uniref:indole-3-glycerol phosphate synthase n=1 Tax=Helicobacter bizzozeronii TaxID=56877 RepID=UPI000CF1756D|nr:indole-3-glycerol phosphate synthase [Helicobacter bizzozeronii]
MPIKTLQAYLELKKSLTPFELLGRSLAYNPYVPRLALEDLKRPPSQEIAHSILYLDAGWDLEFLLEKLSQADKARALLLDFTPLYTQGMPALEALDLLGYIRRLSPKPLIHKDYFIDPYQILESLVHGADALLLNASLLAKNLKEILEYSVRLGLLGIVQVATPKELKTSILAKAPALYFPQNFNTLLELTPQRPLIFKDLDDLVPNAQNSYGADGLVIKLSKQT